MGLNRYTIPLIKKSYPSLIASKLVGVQPMMAPASLLFYLRYKYASGRMVPAAPDIIGAVTLWIIEQFPDLKLEQVITYSSDAPGDNHQELVPHEFKVCPNHGSPVGMRVAVLLVWDGTIEFYQSKFEMADPYCFDELHAAITEYFWPKEKDHA